VKFQKIFLAMNLLAIGFCLHYGVFDNLAILNSSGERIELFETLKPYSMYFIAFGVGIIFVDIVAGADFGFGNDDSYPTHYPRHLLKEKMEDSNSRRWRTSVKMSSL